METRPQTYSRYQVLCAEREAWHEGPAAEDVRYFYDGISFWRRDAKGKKRLLPSWRTPAHGWRHSDGCDCDLCQAQKPARVRPAVA